MKMNRTVRVPIPSLAGYLEVFTKRFLDGVRPRAVDVEILEIELGDQLPIVGARLVGITYDRHKDTIELALDSGDHRVEQPRSVWAIEESDGFISVIRLVTRDGHEEIVSVRRVGLLRVG
jgi:hypothetical protein